MQVAVRGARLMCARVRARPRSAVGCTSGSWWPVEVAAGAVTAIKGRRFTPYRAMGGLAREGTVCRVRAAIRATAVVGVARTWLEVRVGWERPMPMSILLPFQRALARLGPSATAGPAASTPRVAGATEGTATTGAVAGVGTTAPSGPSSAEEEAAAA